MAAKAPDAPESPTSSFADQTTITIDWTAPYNGGSDITSYTVQWNLGGPGTDFYDLSTVSASTLTFTQSGLTTGEIYTFRVFATNYIDPSAPSGTLQVYAATKPLQPSTPAEVSADQNQITIRWTATAESTGTSTGFNGGSTITSYKIYVKHTGNFEEVHETTTLSNLEYQLTSSVTGHTLTGNSYAFKVSAVNVVGESDLSEEIVIIAALVPQAATNLAKVSADVS